MLNDTLTLLILSHLWDVAPSVPGIGFNIIIFLGVSVMSHQGDKNADGMNEQLHSSLANLFPRASGEQEV